MNKVHLIAIVDDDAIVRDATRELLSALGYKVTTFSSAEELLSSRPIHEVSCVITDVRMPGMSGVDLQAQLRADGVSIPIIFMTAFPEDKDQARALAAGASGFLVKPYREEALVTCIGSALGT